ncbi:hypothetical protein KUA24_145 [Vibrio phage HNL01]|nr:hypothetical protein KUA24_145 [Vibrio phage HNL01]
MDTTNFIALPNMFNRSQRAVDTLEGLGYTYEDGVWAAPKIEEEATVGDITNFENLEYVMPDIPKHHYWYIPLDELSEPQIEYIGKTLETDNRWEFSEGEDILMAQKEDYDGDFVWTNILQNVVPRNVHKVTFDEIFKVKAVISDEEEEDSFDNLRYVAPERSEGSTEYFGIRKDACSEDQWAFLLENLTLHKTTKEVSEVLFICNDANGWFDTAYSNIEPVDTMLSFNDLFIEEV